MLLQRNAGVLAELQSDILRLQGFKSVHNATIDNGLGLLNTAFPNATFPLGCMHEFMTPQYDAAAPTVGFLAALLALLTKQKGTVLWISPSRMIFPHTLKSFGIVPDRVLFADVSKEKEALWTMEEALKCDTLTAVVGEVREVSFIESRRFQLAAEQSQVTGFILLRNAHNPNNTACASRWKITSLESESIDG